MTPETRKAIQRLVGSITTMLALAGSTASAQQFIVTGSMSVPRGEPATTILNDGTVLFAGGLIGGANKVVLNTAEIYDPNTDNGTFHLTGTLNQKRLGATATLLNTGKVLIAGGEDFVCGGGSDCPLTSAELYDPLTGTFTPTGSLQEPRAGHTATLLANGTVLVVGGLNSFIGPAPLTGNAEIYDPIAGTFSVLQGHLGSPRAFHTATLLNSGKVLITGGENPFGLAATAELYDPALQTFTNTGALGTARWVHTATLLIDGRVLVAGGLDANDTSLSTAELYNPIAGVFDPAERLIEARFAHTATRLSDGTILLVGGYVQDVVNNASITIASAEIYDANTGEFTRIASLNTARGSASAVLLTSGQVLIAGGQGVNGQQLTSTEVFQPGTNAFALLAGGNTFSGNQTVSGNVTATSFIGNGAGLTGVNASTLGGIAVGLFARRDTSNLFTGDQTINGTVTATSFAGDGSGLTGVTATSAVFALNAGDSLRLGGIAANRYARLDIANAFTGDQAVTGNMSTTGTVKIGGGTPIVEHLSRTLTISLPAMSPGNCNTSSIAVGFPGATDGDTLALGIPNAMTSSGTLTYFAWVSAANSVSFRVCNPRGPSSAPLTGSVRVDIWKH